MALQAASIAYFRLPCKARMPTRSYLGAQVDATLVSGPSDTESGQPISDQDPPRAPLSWMVRVSGSYSKFSIDSACRRSIA